MELNCPYCGSPIQFDKPDMTSFDVRGSMEERGVVVLEASFIARHRCGG